MIFPRENLFLRLTIFDFPQANRVKWSQDSEGIKEGQSQGKDKRCHQAARQEEQGRFQH